LLICTNFQSDGFGQGRNKGIRFSAKSTETRRVDIQEHGKRCWLSLSQIHQDNKVYNCENECDYSVYMSVHIIPEARKEVSAKKNKLLWYDSEYLFAPIPS